jgi:hypothetical protein
LALKLVLLRGRSSLSGGAADASNAPACPGHSSIDLVTYPAASFGATSEIWFCRMAGYGSTDRVRRRCLGHFVRVLAGRGAWETVTSKQLRERATPALRAAAGSKTVRNGSAPTSPESSAPQAKTGRRRGSILASRRGNTARRSASLPRCNGATASLFPVVDLPTAVGRAPPDPMPRDLLPGALAGVGVSAEECAVAPRG